MRKNIRVAVVAVGFLFAHVVGPARDVPVARAADDGAEIAKLKAEIEEQIDLGNWVTQIQAPARSYTLRVRCRSPPRHQPSRNIA